MRKFSGHRPVMFYQDAKGTQAVTSDCSRVRIFYPGGDAEWATLSENHNPDTSGLFFGQIPCWLYQNKSKSTSINKAIALAEKYDERMGFPKMIFLGEV